jgi:hypothetical protein
MKIKCQVQRLDMEVWSYALDVPLNQALEFVSGEDRRVICKIGPKVKFHCALMPNGSNGYYIILNKDRRQKLGLVQGQVVDIELEKDSSEYGMSISEELQEVLLQDEAASKAFHILTPGKQRSLIYWVDNVKSSEIKIRRAIVLTSHLLLNEKPDFKLLNQELKGANQLAKLSKG